jgi:hypothetical protein
MNTRVIRGSWQCVTPALVPTNDRIPIMYITTNSKTIITPNNYSPDLPGTHFSIEPLFINPQI